MKIELIAVNEAAKSRGVHVDTLYQAMQDGRLDYAECEGKRMLLLDQVQAFAPARRGRKPAAMRTEEMPAP